MDKVRVGVAGAGFIDRIHVEALRRLGFVEVVAISANGQTKADAAAKELHIAKAYGNSADMLKDDEIDAVHIATPNHLHCPLARKAIHGRSRRSRKCALDPRPLFAGLAFPGD